MELFLRGTPRLNLKVDSFTKISFLVGLSVNYSLFRCMIGTELSLTTLWVDIANWNHKKPNFDRKFVSGAPLSEICKGEAVVDLSALEYGPSHQLDLALRPAEDPFLAKKVRVWVGWLEN